MDWYPLKLTAHGHGHDFGERLVLNLLGETGVPDGKVSDRVSRHAVFLIM